MKPRLLPIIVAAAMLLAAAARGADKPPQVVNPVGDWARFAAQYEKIIQVDVPLRGTLREVYIDRISGRLARLTGQLPYGTKLVMRDFGAAPDGKGGWLTRNGQFVPGEPTGVLVQEKEKGWGARHPASIRNGEWEYAVYTLQGQPIAIDAEKSCMGCHKQVENTDYTFLVQNFFANWMHR